MERNRKEIYHGIVHCVQTLPPPPPPLAKLVQEFYIGNYLDQKIKEW